MTEKKLLSIKVNDESYNVECQSTPTDLIKKYLNSNKDIIVCKIDGRWSDLGTVINQDCTLSFHTFEEAKDIFWHSSAHILGNALTNIYPNCKLVNGPPTDEGFFYDVDIDTPISSDDFKRIENEMKNIIKKNIPFKKISMSKEELLDLYKDNPCKSYFVKKKVENNTSVYRNKDFYDMCEGPHVSSTGVIKAVKVLKNSSAYFLGDPSQKQLQRIYAISFPSKEMLSDWTIKRERALQRDHRKIGKELNLYFFHDYSPGSCFFLPNGAHIYNKLVEFIRTEYKKRGFDEVISPNIYSVDLWKKSGHYDNYKDNIFMLEHENMALKPMNCPGHCMMFKSIDHSFKELPIRFADFGVLHRNELSGALSGLTRVRRFQQDDAHIFCRRDQIKKEIESCLNFVKHVYGIFKFKFELFLSTRPLKYIGNLEEWNEAEKSLEDAIKEVGLKYTLNEGDGAFYGPKIDIILQDALGRKIQCATIQLDFQLPQRFDLKYRSSQGGLEMPVIIHRAILGSVERFIAILVENYGKKLPFWLTPRQVSIISLANDEYTNKVAELFKDFKMDIFKDGNSINKNIRNSIVNGYNMICVIGEREAKDNTINLRYQQEQRIYDITEFKNILNFMEVNKIEYDEYLKMENLKI